MWQPRALVLYHDEKFSANKTFKFLCEEGYDVTLPRIRLFLKRKGVYRTVNEANALVGYVGKPRGWLTVRRKTKSCEHCHNEYAPKSRTQRWCDVCCPDADDKCRMSAYGIIRSQYDMLLKRAQNQCEICHETFDSINIDHDHVTGKVRGLLCTTCNLLLGHFDKKPEWFSQSSDYLRMNFCKI
jgi:recombination endonuclease VII